jgi:outer membrane protein assembly factor BamB
MGLIACNKQMQGTDPCDCGGCCDTLATPIKLLWKQPLAPDSSENWSMKPAIFQDKVVFSLLFYTEGQEYYKVYNKQTGKFLWQWEATPLPGTAALTEGWAQKDNMFIINSNFKRMYAFDMNTDQLAWSYIAPYQTCTGGPNINIMGDFVYHEQSKNQIDLDSSFLTRLHYKTGACDTVFTLNKENTYSPSPYPPALWVNPNGDSILVFQNRQISFKTLRYKCDLYALNLRTRKIEWKLDSLTSDGNSSVKTPLVYNGKVYFFGARELHCVDIQTGTIKWQKPCEKWDHLLTTNLVLAEGKLLYKPHNDGYLYAVDPETGNEIYRRPDTETGEADIAYYKGNIYYGSKYLYCIRVSDGKVLWKMESPTKRSSPLMLSVSIDQTTGKLYVADKYYAMCFQL